jgi:3-phenylpropionate/trans-cinnamate dioxygenase ferredoxin subunit
VATSHVLARTSEIPPGGRHIVKIAGRTVGVFNVAGAFYALKNSCIHEQGPVCLGKVTGTFLPSQPGVFRWAKDGQILRCPWHGWEFDLTTGQSVFDPTVRLSTYPVRIEDGNVVVEL